MPVHYPDRRERDPGGIAVKGARQGITRDARSAPLTVISPGSRLERREDGRPQCLGSEAPGAGGPAVRSACRRRCRRGPKGLRAAGGAARNPAADAGELMPPTWFGS
jgi:hypothetical protein